MNIKQLRTFLITLEEQQVGKAARKLGVSQPAISQQLRNLEKELGFDLLMHQGRDMVLTRAGEAFLPYARQALKAANEGIEAGLRAARGERGCLMVGYCHSSLFEPELPALLRSFSALWPDIELQLRDMPVLQQIDALHQHRLDLAFARTPIGEDDAQHRLRIQPFSRTELALVLPQGHPLAAQSTVDLADLANENFLLLDEPDGIGLRFRVLSACRAAGFTPRAMNTSTNMTSIISMVSAGMGVALAPAGLQALNVPGVVFRPLHGLALVSELAMLSRSNETAGSVLRFIDQVWSRSLQESGSAAGMTQAAIEII